MQNLCLAIVDLATLGCHADYWAARYQSGFFALFAVLIAFTQMRIARRQSIITREQFRMANEQRIVDRSVALVQLDPFMNAALRALDLAVAAGTHRDTGKREGDLTVWNWDESSALLKFKGLRVPDNIEDLAIKAFPAQAPELVQFAGAVREAAELAAEFEANPWFNADLGQDARAVEKAAAADDVLNRIFWFGTGKLRTMQAHLRD